MAQTVEEILATVKKAGACKCTSGDTPRRFGKYEIKAFLTDKLGKIRKIEN